MQSQSRHALGARAESGLGLIVFAAVFLSWTIQRFVPMQPGDSQVVVTPVWLPPAAAGFAAAGILPLAGTPLWLRLRQALRWTALLLMVWAASGLPFDLLAALGLMGYEKAGGEMAMSTVYWPGLITQAFALAAVVLIARIAFASSAAAASSRPATWYGYIAFLLALPYPVLRLHWALGGTLGLLSPGAAGKGWEPLLIAIPWVAAAILSLFLVRPPRWISRRMLLLAGWSATAIVATIGPAAFWGFYSALAGGADMETGDIELWVYALFYTSWFLWAVAGGAATRSYQLRSATLPAGSPA